MDFARKQLLKYGWSEGKGLGKNESGIAEALKPTLKFDTTGVGHDPSEQFTFNWWENVYNQAADNIKVEKSNCGTVNLKVNSNDSVDITTKKHSYKHFKRNNINLEYGSFLKTSKLVPDLGVVDHEEKVSINCFEPMETVKVANLTDEQLFAACGGRTAHKGARHGLKLNGKLARIEEQEMLLLQNMKEKANDLHVVKNKMDNKYSLFESDEQKVKHKKKKKKEKNECEIDEMEMKKRKKAKKRKSQPDNSDQEDDNQFIEEEAARKRTEYICAKQRKKKMECLKNREKKRLNNMTNLFENVCSVNVQDNKDDGFVENTNDDESDRKKMRSKKKRRKHNKEAATDENDDGFEECINEVSEKLIHYKELRMNLQKEKKKGDDNRISKMAEEFENTL